MSKHYLYIARCKDQSLYIGSTVNPIKRVVKHNKKQGSQWVKQHGAAEIVYQEEYTTRLEARRRESQIKKWSRIKKENLIKYGHPKIKKLE